MFRWLHLKPGDIAQHVIALMQDSGGWEAKLMSVRRADLGLVVHNDWAVAVSVGGVRLRFEGWDSWAVQRAYYQLRKQISGRRRLQAAQRIRDNLAIPTAAPATRALAPADEAEALEVVEARVRQLREAVLRAS